MKDKVIIITGGCQGLGRIMGEYLTGKGAKLALIDLDHERLDEVVVACRATGGNARAYVCNVADREQVTHVMTQVASDFGAINGLVNNADIPRNSLTIKVKDGQLNKMSLVQWQSVININLTGVPLYTHGVAARTAELKSEGAIVDTSSVSRAGNMGQADYSAAKAGVIAGTVIWAKELARCGTRVAGVAPGFTETEMTAGMRPEALEKMTADVPLKCMGKPVEIVHSVAYIFENNYYTGRVLELNGGLRL